MQLGSISSSHPAFLPITQHFSQSLSIFSNRPAFPQSPSISSNYPASLPTTQHFSKLSAFISSVEKNTLHVVELSKRTFLFFLKSNYLERVAVISAKNLKRQRRKRQSVTAKREKSQTPQVLTAVLTLPNLT